MLSDKDLKQIEAKGIDLAKVEMQLKQHKHGFPFLNIVKAATVNDGIYKFSQKAEDEYIWNYEETLDSKKIVKFVPASGAASRMFKHLFEFIENYSASNADKEKYFKDNSLNSVGTFFDRIDDFAFIEDLEKQMGMKASSAVEKQEYKAILDSFLGDDGLNYGNLPKGLLKFHKYDSHNRTPVEEHLVEGGTYCNSNGNVYIHFTVSSEHQPHFESLIKEVISVYEKMFNVKFHISYSVQKPSTDTIAVDMNNEPFREDDGSILFRPGGHGALIENLNDLDCDIVFIKNIDNVLPDRLKESTIRYKKLLGGVLVDFQKKVFAYLDKLEDKSKVDEGLLKEVEGFIKDYLNVWPPESYSGFSHNEKLEYIVGKLNRPIRVCGIVPNSGEPGGGPFRAVSADGSIQPQIGESSQIHPDKVDELFANATHFSPTDLVCGIKNYKGEKFDLLTRVDRETGFISKKSKNGKELKALELPGLWNGSMSDWNTIFVEVPLITFNPVKTINDLLRKEHLK